MSRHHQLLEVPAGATRAQVKSAFRKKARRLHPDMHPDMGAEERTRAAQAFEEVVAAYRALLAMTPDDPRVADVPGVANGSGERPVAPLPDLPDGVRPAFRPSPTPPFVAATYRRYGDSRVDTYA